jgi:hypothetical protein
MHGVAADTIRVMITEDGYNQYIKGFITACATNFSQAQYCCQAPGSHHRVVGSLHSTLIICNIRPYGQAK